MYGRHHLRLTLWPGHSHASTQAHLFDTPSRVDYKHVIPSTEWGKARVPMTGGQMRPVTYGIPADTRGCTRTSLPGSSERLPPERGVEDRTTPPGA